MLYILPPPSGPTPPSPWSSIVYSNNNTNQHTNESVSHNLGVAQQINNKISQMSPRRSRYRALSKFRNRFESAGPDEDDSAINKSLSECYFAGKSATAVLGPIERIRSSLDGQRLTNTSTTTINANVPVCTSGSDHIQVHLQEMFSLLRPEETLKMAVKLESIRSGRTRYLVVVSRPSLSTLLNETSTDDCSDQLSEQQQNAQNPRQNSLTKKPSNFSPKQLKQQKDPCSLLNNNNLSNFSIMSSTSSNNDNLTSDNDNKNNVESSFRNDCDKNLSSANNYIANDYLNSEDFCKNNSNVCGNSGEREESCLLGIDCNEKTSVGLVLRILADTTIRLDGDGGFSVTVCGRTHIFKPVSVQAMWSALQTLHKVSSKAREGNFYPGGPSHDWVSYYENHIESDRSCLNEWNTMDSLESRRPPSPDTIRNKPTEREETERVIRTALKEIMMVVDLDEVTSKYIRVRLEEHLDMDLAEFKSYIDQEMLTILGQMDAPTEVFDHVYLGSEWNASNLEELQRNGVGHILNVTREIDNFFPGNFDYFNVRVYDDEKTDLLKHWDKTFKYITRAKIEGSKVLVHCKMGVSRSASVVIAYAMKEYNMDFDNAMKHVKEKRSCIKPNRAFLSQLETYQGMLDAMKNKEKLQRSKSETNLESPSKDARLLPGSEPTPLIQALNVGKAKLLNVSGKEIRLKTGDRPKSWSPDNVESSVLLPKPQSQSLEHLAIPSSGVPPQHQQSPQQSESKTKHIRLPCCNGQNYSVSQNQAVHLQEESISTTIPSVKLIISELESYERNKNLQMNYDKSNKSVLILDGSTESSSTTDACCDLLIDNQLIQNTIVWDPGEELSSSTSVQTATAVMNIDSNSDTSNKFKICDSPVWTSSAQLVHQAPIVNLSLSESKELLNNSCISNNSSSINVNPNKKDGDLFSSQLDRVFEREENKMITDLPPTSLSSSMIVTTSSTTSANAIPPHVSRQNSWSSVDSAVVMRDTPSRHSSWGSGDNTVHHHIPSRNSSFNSYDLKSRMMENSCGIFPYDKDEIPWHPGTVKRTKQKIEELAVAKRLCSDTNDENRSDNDIITSSTTAGQKLRSHSEEILGGRSLSSSYYSRLSASAPETSAMRFLDGNTTIPLRRSQYKTRFSVDESSTPSNNNDNQLPGIVRNLKMNFEAKSTSTKNQKMSKNNNQEIEVTNPKGKGRSLPSSPVALHNDLMTNSIKTISRPASLDSNTEDKEIINVKGLVDKYEITKMRCCNSVVSFNNNKQRPRSEYHPNQCIGQTATKPLMLTHSKITTNSVTGKSLDDSRRPPVPPTVKNTLGNTNNSCSPTTNMIKMTNNKKAQQGKTHPLARLGNSLKQRVNTAAYNTM